MIGNTVKITLFLESKETQDALMKGFNVHGKSLILGYEFQTHEIQCDMGHHMGSNFKVTLVEVPKPKKRTWANLLSCKN